MSALQFPRVVFKTRRWMDDYGASDMRCGDLSESQLKSKFHLSDVSSEVNPYTLTKISAFNQPQSRFYGMRGEGDKISRQQCTDILFDEFRHLSLPFALYSPYRYLIKNMITHMQRSGGAPYGNLLLNSALEQQILNDSSEVNSTRILLTYTLRKNIEWDNKYYPKEREAELENSIRRGKLPKFDRIQDSFNGMGITVHDIWAMTITILSLHIDNDSFRVRVRYDVQDHFGLDDEDMYKVKFNQLRFFRIWFVLQRYNQFGFRPFMTNLSATIEVTGKRYDK